MGYAKGWMVQGQEDLSLCFVTPLLNSQLAELFQVIQPWAWGQGH